MPRNDLKADAVREMLDYDPATGTLTWRWRKDKLPNINARWVGKIAGRVATDGRRLVRINGKAYLAHRLAWLHYNSKWPKEEIDHVNLDPLDNRIENLREASRGQNQANCRAHRDNKSGYKGVSWQRQHQRWQAQIQVDKKPRHLGLFPTREAAYAAYCSAAKELHGKFARTA